MLKAERALERIFGTLIPGAFLLLVTWYLHRPFLLKYFPNIAGDPTQSAGLSTEFKIGIFLVASFCAGLLLNQLGDVGIALMFKDDASNEKSMQRTRRFARRVWRRIAFSLNIVVHLKTISDKSKRLLNEAELPVVFSSSVLMAFALLIPIAALSFWTANLVDEKITVHLFKTLAVSVGLLYLGLLLSSYSLKRQFKQFCNYVLTLGLHFHRLPREIDTIAEGEELQTGGRPDGE